MTGFRFSTDDLPERDRLTAWREFYGRKMLRLENEPLSDLPFHAAIALRQLPGLSMVSADLSPLRVGRTRELITDGNDAVTFQIASTDGLAIQRGREVEVAAGAAIGLSNADVGSFDFPSGAHVLALSLSRRTLAMLVRDIDGMLVRAVPNETKALWLLKRYVRIFDDPPALAAPELLQVAVTHVYDLAALAFGATQEAAEIANGRGVRAARLQVILAEIKSRFADPKFSPTELAARLGVSTRYVQDLLHETDMTFSERVMELRLRKAHAMLSDSPASMKIIDIAYACGFGDISYFNRCFRRRYGASPSEFRNPGAGAG